MNSEAYLFIYIAAALGGAMAMFFLMRLMGYTAPDSRRAKELAQWEDERYKAQKRRLKAIQKICNTHMDSLPPRLRTMDRQILVTYEDLLRIWDGCNHVEDNL